MTIKKGYRTRADIRKMISSGPTPTGIMSQQLGVGEFEEADEHCQHCENVGEDTSLSLTAILNGKRGCAGEPIEEYLEAYQKQSNTAAPADKREDAYRHGEIFDLLDNCEPGECDRPYDLEQL